MQRVQGPPAGSLGIGAQLFPCPNERGAGDSLPGFGGVPQLSPYFHSMQLPRRYDMAKGKSKKPISNSHSDRTVLGATLPALGVDGGGVERVDAVVEPEKLV